METTKNQRFHVQSHYRVLVVFFKIKGLCETRMFENNLYISIIVVVMLFFMAAYVGSNDLSPISEQAGDNFFSSPATAIKHHLNRMVHLLR